MFSSKTVFSPTKKHFFTKNMFSQKNSVFTKNMFLPKTCFTEKVFSPKIMFFYQINTKKKDFSQKKTAKLPYDRLCGKAL